MSETITVHVGMLSIVLIWTAVGYFLAKLLIKWLGNKVFGWVVVFWVTWQLSVVYVISAVFPPGSVGGIFLGAILVLSFLAVVMALGHLAKSRGIQVASRYGSPKGRDGD